MLKRNAEFRYLIKNAEKRGKNLFKRVVQVDNTR